MNGLEITEVNIRPITNQDKDNYNNPVKAKVRIIFNNAFVVTEISIVQGKFGPFISFPRKYDSGKKLGYNIAYPITKAFQEYISAKILTEYKTFVEVN